MFCLANGGELLAPKVGNEGSHNQIFYATPCTTAYDLMAEKFRQGLLWLPVLLELRILTYLGNTLTGGLIIDTYFNL